MLWITWSNCNRRMGSVPWARIEQGYSIHEPCTHFPSHILICKVTHRYKVNNIFQRRSFISEAQAGFGKIEGFFCLCTKAILPCSNTSLRQRLGSTVAGASAASRSRCSFWSLIWASCLLSTWKKMNSESVLRNQFCSLAMKSAHFLKSP